MSAADAALEPSRGSLLPPGPESTASESVDYLVRRGEIERYFDRTALEAWAQMTSDAPVSRVRQTVRAGRDAMRAQLLGWLGGDLAGRRVLDAGCGPGMLSAELARRGAEVVGVDLSPELVRLGRERLAPELASRVRLEAGDLLDPRFGRFDHAVLMDVLIHYDAAATADMLARLAGRVERSILFTVAPSTPLLQLMHAAGRLFPRADRAPAIQPTVLTALRRRLASEPGLQGWRLGRTGRIHAGFYISQGMELVRA